MADSNTPEMVNLTIDGKPVRVPKGTNLIEAAKTIGIEIPHYCYHPNLSIAGNCRMCQVQVKGAPKLDIGCNTMVREGMEVSTHLTSKAVDDAQAATLEFILINHPLDCTVCDQAGHCKLQDYHFEYNARPSRFLEDKVHKVKAEPVGPHVMLDGERCILCTRCVRFCDEVTKTSELGVLNRGDRSVIAVNEGKVLDNPLSGTVVDLCPVGALTHRDWRFNTRIWFTKQTDTICPGCSTGCNAKVAVRDGQVVQVKARYNAEVNKEWMCDEGRYGFHRYLPRERLKAPTVGGSAASWDDALKAAAALKGHSAVVFLEPQLLLEDFWAVKQFAEKHLKNAFIAVQYRERPLTPVEAILISPDYAPNFRAAEFLGMGPADAEGRYNEALRRLRAGDFQAALLIGDRAVLPEDLDVTLLDALGKMKASVSVISDAEGALAAAAQVVLPGRTVLEKSGLMINRAMRLQYSDRVVEYPQNTEPAWRAVNRIAEKCGAKLVTAASDRDMTIACLAGDHRLKGLRLPAIKQGGIPLNEPRADNAEGNDPNAMEARA